MDTEPNADVVMGSSAPIETTVSAIEPSSVKKSSVQSTLSAFIVPKESTQTSMAHIQSRINELLVKTDSLQLKENYVEVRKSELVACNTTILQTTESLLEISHQDIKVETTASGCCITCVPCSEYAMSRVGTKL